MRRALISLSLIAGCFVYSFGQTCTCDADVNGTNTLNANTAGLWTATGGATCPPTSTFTGNVVIDIGTDDKLIWNYPLNMTGNMTVTLANAGTLEVNADLNITGSVPITNNGSSVIQINAGADVHVIGAGGNMGDPQNNNVTLIVNGTLQVDGTFSANNQATISGTGDFGGGTLNIGQNSSCSSPCPASGGFTNCSSGSPNFCTTYAPITLSYFRVEVPKGEKQVLLEWGTEAEEGFDHFEVQRAGKDLDFTSILNVPGAGYNTSSLQQYSAYDKSPLVGTGYYRLKAVDLDGSFEYFHVKSVSYNGGRHFYISPNPTTGSVIKYNINFDPTPNDRVVLIDAIGNELASGVVSGVENELIPNKTLPPGPYLLQYISGNYKGVARVFIKE